MVNFQEKYQFFCMKKMVENEIETCLKLLKNLFKNHSFSTAFFHILSFFSFLTKKSTECSMRINIFIFLTTLKLITYIIINIINTSSTIARNKILTYICLRKP